MTFSSANIMPVFSTFTAGGKQAFFNWDFGNPKQTYDNGIAHLTGNIILQDQANLDTIFQMQRPVSIRSAGDLFAGGMVYVDHWGDDPSGILDMHILKQDIFLGSQTYLQYVPTPISYTVILTSMSRDSSSPDGLHHGTVDFVILTPYVHIPNVYPQGTTGGTGGTGGAGDGTGTGIGGPLITTGTINFTTPSGDGDTVSNDQDVGGDITYDTPAGAYINVLVTNETQGTANQTRAYINDDGSGTAGTWVATIPWVDGTDSGDDLTISAALYDPNFNMLDIGQLAVTAA